MEHAHSDAQEEDIGPPPSVREGNGSDDGPHAAFLASVGLHRVDEPNSASYSFALQPNGSPIGRLWYMDGALTNIKVQCLFHPQNACEGVWVKKQGHDPKKMFDACVRCLLDGAHDCTAKQHKDKWHALKVSVGMRPKKSKS